MTADPTAGRNWRRHRAVGAEARPSSADLVSVEMDARQGEVDAREGVCVVRLVGELDLATHDQVDRVLRDVIAGASGPILVDLRDLTFIDCRGARIIAAARRRAARHGQCLRIDGARGLVRRVIELAG